MNKEALLNHLLKHSTSNIVDIVEEYIDNLSYSLEELHTTFNDVESQRGVENAMEDLQTIIEAI